jgi:hypothetical protein
MLAFALIAAGLPLVSSAIAGDHQTAFTLDICNPAQALSGASIPCSIPLPSSGPQHISPGFAGMVAGVIAPTESRAADPPGIPPPKISAL